MVVWPPLFLQTVTDVHDLISLQAEQQNGVLEEVREKWHVATAENRTLSTQLETRER